MLEAFNSASDTMGSSERRKIANKIISGAGDYLENWNLPGFISAEISDEKALELIKQRRTFIERASCLMPSLLSLFQVGDDSVLRSILLRTEDCCHDFPLIRKSPHGKKLRKDALNGLGKLKDQLSSLSGILESVGHHVSNDFDVHMGAVDKFLEKSDRLIWDYYDAFREELSCLSLAVDIVLFKETRGQERIFIGDNKSKTHIVECVYSIAIQRDGPAFVTTPGSDFSIACGLLYELASGERDVSMAGAINKFAHSSLRKRLDDEEREIRWQNSDEGVRAYETDNFAAIKNGIAQLIKERKFWKEMIASKDWTEFEKRQLVIRLLHIDDRLALASREHGPHLVWANQISERERTAHWREMQEWDVQRLKSEIELGRQRRKKSDG